MQGINSDQYKDTGGHLRSERRPDGGAPHSVAREQTRRQGEDPSSSILHKSVASVGVSICEENKRTEIYPRKKIT